MKRLTAMSAILTFLPLASFAGGLEFIPNDPVVIAPARVQRDWTGPYVGLSYGRKVNLGDVYQDKCVKGTDAGAYLNDIGGYIDYSGTFDCSYDYSIFGPEYHAVSIGRESLGQISKSTESFGAFVGWRYDLGRVVAGIEAGHAAGITTVEGQAGVDLGNVLIYGLAGGSDQGSFYGAGADVRLGNRVMVGVKGIEGDFGQLTTIRLGIEF